MYRLTVETLLGLHLEADHLRIAPCVPADWQAYTIHYRYRETVYHITVKRIAGQSGQAIRVIPLVDDRQEHYVEVVLGAEDAAG